MQVVKLRHVKKYRSSGKVYWYHRITGERLPVEEEARAGRVLEIDSGLESDRPRTLPGSLRDLIGQYRAGPDFRRLADSTRKSYDGILCLLLRAWPDKPADEINRA